MKEREEQVNPKVKLVNYRNWSCTKRCSKEKRCLNNDQYRRKEDRDDLKQGVYRRQTHGEDEYMALIHAINSDGKIREVELKCMNTHTS